MRHTVGLMLRNREQRAKHGSLHRAALPIIGWHYDAHFAVALDAARGVNLDRRRGLGSHVAQDRLLELAMDAVERGSYRFRLLFHTHREVRRKIGKVKIMPREITA